MKVYVKDLDITTVERNTFGGKNEMVVTDIEVTLFSRGRHVYEYFEATARFNPRDEVVDILMDAYRYGKFVELLVKPSGYVIQSCEEKEEEDGNRK